MVLVLYLYNIFASVSQILIQNVEGLLSLGVSNSMIFGSLDSCFSFISVSAGSLPSSSSSSEIVTHFPFQNHSQHHSDFSQLGLHCFLQKNFLGFFPPLKISYHSLHHTLQIFHPGFLHLPIPSGLDSIFFLSHPSFKPFLQSLYSCLHAGASTMKNFLDGSSNTNCQELDILLGKKGENSPNYTEMMQSFEGLHLPCPKAPTLSQMTR